jgi:translation initiation factor IF-2
MSETKETIEKTVRAGIRKPLSLKRTVESGHVQQKFSHGRSKSVVVEKKKKRTLLAPETHEPSVTAAPPVEPRAMQRTQASSAEPARAADLKQPTVLRTLSEEERAARAKALAAAHVRDAEEERIRAEHRRLEALEAEERQRREEAEGELRRSREIEEAKKREATGQEKADVGPKDVALEVQAKVPSAEAVVTKPASEPQVPVARPELHAPAEASAPILKPIGMTRPVIVSRPDRPSAARPTDTAKKTEPDAPKRLTKAVAPLADLSEEEDARVKKKPGKVLRGPAKGVDEGRVRGRLTITNAFDERQRERSLASLKRKREREKLKALGIPQPREKIVREVVIPEAITIQELSNRMSERAVDLIKFLMKQGEMHKITDVIDADTAELIVQEFGHTPKRVSEADVEEGFIGERDAEEHLEPRAPVVTIMGHVDHGKTSLLDAIRHANVAAGEAGGITQHIGAYQVQTPGGGPITFIDTPGHEAFTAMRARGAKVTDIVVLVVAADDGVMPQTVEAINHARAAKVPIIVAINKIDKANADPNRVRAELLQHGVVVESMSGDTLDVPVSAVKGTNLDKLLEAITLQAEVLELRANPARSAEGFVIEAKLERGRGPVGTLLVQRGTLRLGDIVVAGAAWGRVRALIDDKGQNVREAGPSVPVEVLGFDAAPEAGDQFAVVESEARAREITDYRMRKRRETLGTTGAVRTLEQMMQQLKEAGKKEFPLLVKGDVQGSVEAICGALKKLGTDEVEARLVHFGVGAITESDVALAHASKAVIVGFNVRANAQAKAAAERDGVEIRYYNIIYDLVDDVKAAMSGLLAPSVREVFLGNARILEVFNVSKVGKVAGCRVTDGKVERGAKVRLIRDNVVIHEGTLATLKRFKDEVKEVPAGQECGMAFANYQDLRQGDVIECFNVETVTRTL